MSPARAILLEVGGMGMIREILFKQNYIQDPRRATILFDELNGIIWVWLGTDVNLKTRKAILPVAEKMLSTGYKSKMDGILVGQNCSQLITIDQRNIADPGVQQRHQTALNLFNMNYVQDGRFVVQFEASPAKTRVDPRTTALAGIMIASILESSPEVFVGKTSQGIYSIDIGQGTIKFQIRDGNIQLVQGSIGLNDQIQRAFQENIKTLK
ncbi:MAG: hypothetical protein HWN66_12505 [Candidatus Helarchaeota archaeon]|nr:hypothetical protein [Candidatus Helarchaeota archaeon]